MVLNRKNISLVVGAVFLGVGLLALPVLNNCEGVSQVPLFARG